MHYEQLEQVISVNSQWTLYYKIAKSMLLIGFLSLLGIPVRNEVMMGVIVPFSVYGGPRGCNLSILIGTSPLSIIIVPSIIIDPPVLD